MPRWAAKIASVVVAASCLTAAGCDDKAPARQERRLPIPKGESTLDQLIRKSEEKPRPPPTPGRLEPSQTSLDFSEVAIGGASVRHVRLTNLGEAPVAFLKSHVAGAASAYVQGGDCTEGSEIAAGKSCILELAFHPDREGEVDGELVIEQGGAGPSRFVALKGEGRPAISRSGRGDALVPPSASNAALSLTYASLRQTAGLVVESASTIAGPSAPARQDDYGEAGLPGIVSSFPVDRSRVITADRYIPAVLENTINSQLPGRAIAVVERHVYGADGRYVLIPAGSRVIGHYQSLAKVGQARLDIAWSRIIRPDGVTINVDTPGADVMGRAGLPGELDTRFSEKYGSSLLTSVIAAAGEWGLDGTSTSVVSPLGGTTQTLSGKARAATRLGNDLDALGQRIVEENVDIRPVLTVAQGTRLNIIPAEDVWL